MVKARLSKVLLGLSLILTLNSARADLKPEPDDAGLHLSAKSATKLALGVFAYAGFKIRDIVGSWNSMPAPAPNLTQASVNTTRLRSDTSFYLVPEVGDHERGFHVGINALF